MTPDEQAAANLNAAAARIDMLLADGGDFDYEALLPALRTVFREAAAHYGGCCTLDCKEHAALVEAAGAILREPEVARWAI